MAPHTILLRGDGVRTEDLAAEAITPGHLLEFVPSGGDSGQVRKHSDASGPCAPMFALENSVNGDEITVAYADGDTVPHITVETGGQVYALLGTSESVNPGQFLDSKGDGTLKKRTSGSFPIAQALEAVINTASIVSKRIRVEIL